MNSDSDRELKWSIAQALQEAFANRDIEGFMRLYADDVKIWHNNDLVEQSRSDNRASLGAFLDMFDALEYSNVKLTLTEDGFVQQHSVRGLLKDGRELLMPAALIVRLRGELISRIDEYLDPAPFFRLVDEQAHD